MIGSSHETRSGRRTIAFVLAFSAAAFVPSGVSYAKPSPGAPLSPAVCKGIGGVWTADTCTIPEGASAVVSSSFKIGDGITLDVKGSLTINRGVTVANSGTLVVENAGGVAPGEFHDAGWETGVLVFGAIDNSGTITIQNSYDASNSLGTEGITISFSLDPPVPGVPSPATVVPGTLTNSGEITIQNSGHTRGITNLGAIANSAPGVITVANRVADSVGIYNRREDLPPKFYVDGTVTNAGSMTIANSGDASGNGLYNQGLFTNTATGSFTISPAQSVDDASVGMSNGGSFTSYGTFTNDRGVFNPTEPWLSTWGSFNWAGTMINYGQASGTGTWYNHVVMVNLGTVTNRGVMGDDSDGVTMINYGTIYNFGLIGGGVNKGICVDEPSTDPNVPGGSGC